MWAEGVVHTPGKVLASHFTVTQAWLQAAAFDSPILFMETLEGSSHVRITGFFPSILETRIRSLTFGFGNILILATTETRVVIQYVGAIFVLLIGTYTTSASCTHALPDKHRTVTEPHGSTYIHKWHTYICKCCEHIG